MKYNNRTLRFAQMDNMYCYCSSQMRKYINSGADYRPLLKGFLT